ncbi:MAG: CBS domain-containing protein [Candidatus Pacearchaeota archaeon]|nr:CBS domain-containing protein [Candidatus Pacearchaeota archaeon]
MLIKEIMKKPYAIEKDILLNDVAKLMKKQNITSLIVVNNNKIVGIITHEDLVENFSEKKKVYSVMSKNVVTIRENDNLKRAVELIRDNKISILPVVDSKKNLVGVISDKDLIGNTEESDDFLIN